MEGGGEMTRDDIIRMAQEAGFEIEKTLYGPVPCVDGRGIDDRLERFAALVAAAEREACAKACDGWMHANGNDCAEAIRARGEV
jgi:ribosomal protein L12E/L44/L45/RPP1/RPP2